MILLEFKCKKGHLFKKKTSPVATATFCVHKFCKKKAFRQDKLNMLKEMSKHGSKKRHHLLRKTQ